MQWRQEFGWRWNELCAFLLRQRGAFIMSGWCPPLYLILFFQTLHYHPHTATTTRTHISVEGHGTWEPAHKVLKKKKMGKGERNGDGWDAERQRDMQNPNSSRWKRQWTDVRPGGWLSYVPLHIHVLPAHQRSQGKPRSRSKSGLLFINLLFS